MDTKPKKASIVLSFLIISAFVGYVLITRYQTHNAFELKNKQVQGLALTTASRLAHSVITLPNSTTLVGLQEYTGTVDTVTVSLDKNFVTTFVPGVKDTMQPRLDVVIPLTITDSAGMSLYVALFLDNGEGVVEQSYARLGGKDVSIQTITTTPGDAGQEYKVDVLYSIGAKQKEVIIPVTDGHFVPNQTVSK